MFFVHRLAIARRERWENIKLPIYDTIIYLQDFKLKVKRK